VILSRVGIVELVDKQRLLAWWTVVASKSEKITKEHPKKR
jgi:hypothetical protein